jgi:hypothetical protein
MVTEGGAAAVAVHIGHPLLGVVGLPLGQAGDTLVLHRSLARPSSSLSSSCWPVYTWFGSILFFLSIFSLWLMTLLGDRCVGVALWVLFFQIYRWLWSTAWGYAWVWSIAVTFPFWLSARVCGVALGGLSEACVLLLFSFSRFSQIAAAGHRAPKWSVIVFGKSYCATHARNPPWAVCRLKKFKKKLTFWTKTV